MMDLFTGGIGKQTVNGENYDTRGEPGGQSCDPSRSGPLDTHRQTEASQAAG